MSLRFIFVIAGALMGLATLSAVILYRDALWPLHHFPYHHSLPTFEVYSDAPIGQIEGVLEDTRRRLAATPLFDADRTFDIILCADPRVYARFAHVVRKPGQTQGFHLHPLGYTFINLSFIREMRTRNQLDRRYSILEGNPAHIIAHEVTHALIEKEVGYLSMRRLPRWKLEGYCEYVASFAAKRNNANYDFEEEVSKYLSGKYGDEAPIRQWYIRSELMVEYFLDREGGDFESLMSDECTEERVWQAVSISDPQKAEASP